LTGQKSGMPDFEVDGWYGLVYPAGAPTAVIAKTHDALSEVLSRDAVKKLLGNIGAEAALSTPEQFRKLIADEIAPLARRGENRGLAAAIASRRFDVLPWFGLMLGRGRKAAPQWMQPPRY
jgi:tripartite-type tricarboxylate transporter receptor subunit TctC